MTRAAVPVESARLKRLRNFLTGVVLVGVVGMAAELLLIGHTDGWYQLIPVVLLTAMAVAMAWRLARPRRLTAWVVRLLMLSSVASGLAGVILHYRGNEAFELEMYPTLFGAALVFETITGVAHRDVSRRAKTTKPFLKTFYCVTKDFASGAAPSAPG